MKVETTTFSNGTTLREKKDIVFFKSFLETLFYSRPTSIKAHPKT
jgi:hypothetical protein